MSPQRLFRGKYTSLAFYLARKAKWTNWVRLPFSRIEGLIGDSLPASAIRKEEWWNNSESTTQGKSWLSVGWEVKEVDLKERIVVFTRPEVLKHGKKRRRKISSKVSIPEFKPRKIKKPSLTRIAKAQARLKNAARRKSSPRKYRGKFKPKSAYEKRLYKPNEKPAT